MHRDEALELLKKHLKNKNLVKHCLAVEACMRAMAVRLGQDVEKWGLAGVLHDLDYELTEKSPELHTTETVKILKDLQIDPDLIEAVQAHAGKVPCQNAMDWSIYSVDPLTGLLIAATLMHPDKNSAQSTWNLSSGGTRKKASPEGPGGKRSKNAGTSRWSWMHSSPSASKRCRGLPKSSGSKIVYLVFLV